MKKALLVYSSVDGQTKKICEVIKSHAENHEVDIIPISKIENIEPYQVVIIGASIRYGKYRDEVFNFIDSNKAILDIQENAFFSVNVVARKKGKDEPDTNSYVIKFLNQTNWKPKKVDVFAGKIDYPKYKIFDKFAIKFIMWVTKGPTDTTQSYEFTDWERVKIFTNSLNL